MALRVLCVSSVLSLVAFLGGCATASVQNFDIKQEKAQSYMESKGSASSANKMLVGQGEASREIFREDVLWGGVYFFGNKPDGDTMPYCAAAMPAFQDELTRRLTGAALPNFNLILDQSTKDAPLVLVVSLSSESSYERPDPLLAGQTRLELDIRAQLLILDPKADMQIVNAYPLGMRAVDSVEGHPNEANWRDLAKYGLCEDLRDKDGRAISVLAQALETLSKRAVAARSLWAPIGVAPIKLQLEHPIAGSFPGLTLEPTATQDWASRFGTSFTTYLAKNSGFPLNPYLSAGDDRFDRDSTIGGALRLTRRSTVQPSITGKLRKPEQILSLCVRDLSLGSIERKENLVEVVEYGCTIDVSLEDAVTATTRAQATVTHSALSAKAPQIARKLAQIARYSYDPQALHSGGVDHAKAFSRYIENLLNVISNCIAHEEDDPSGLFETFRQAMNRN